MHCISAVIMFLICHVTSCDYVTRSSCDFICGFPSPEVTTLLSLVTAQLWRYTTFDFSSYQKFKKFKMLKSFLLEILKKEMMKAKWVNETTATILTEKVPELRYATSKFWKLNKTIKTVWPYRIFMMQCKENV